MASDRILLKDHLAGYPEDAWFDILPRVDYFTRKRVRAQCYVIPEGFNSMASYFAVPENARPAAEILDQGKFERLLLSYVITGWHVSVRGVPVPYPDLTGLPDDVLDLMIAQAGERAGVPTGGTFPGDAPASSVEELRVEP